MRAGCALRLSFFSPSPPAYGSAWLLLALVPAACLIDFVVIRREERYLEARFGDSYLQYKASVRRWI